MNSEKLAFGAIEETNTSSKVLKEVEESRKSFIGASDENSIIGIFNICKWMSMWVSPRSVRKDVTEEGKEIGGKGENW